MTRLRAITTTCWSATVTVFSIVELFVVSAGMSFGQTTTQGNAPLFSEDVSLVRASVVEANRRDGVVEGKLKIEHVYCGASQIKEKTFIAKSSTSPESTTGLDLFPPFKPGEEGIWLVRQDNKGSIVPSREHYWGIRWPVRKEAAERYKEVEKLADILGSVFKASGEKRKALLIEYAIDATPEVSSAAVGLLAKIQPDRAKEAMKDLLTKELPPSSLVVVDEILSQADTDWPSSSKRLEILKNLVNIKVSSEETDRILTRISYSWQGKEMKNEIALDLNNHAASNSSWPSKSRQNALFQIGWMAVQATINNDTSAKELCTSSFNLLLAMVKDSKDVDLRATAARTLGIVPFDKERLAQMKTVLANIDSPDMKKIMEAAIQQIEKTQKEHENRQQESTRPAQ